MCGARIAICLLVDSGAFGKAGTEANTAGAFGFADVLFEMASCEPFAVADDNLNFIRKKIGTSAEQHLKTKKCPTPPPL